VMHDCGPADRKTYDLIVVGAGSAGFSAAITAAQTGAQVLMVGHGTIGGTCVNVGCVPSKNLIRAAEAVHAAGAAGRFPGIAGRAQLADWRALKASKDALVAELREKKYIDLLPQYENMAYVEGKARLVEGGVQVEGDIYRSPRTFIATGSSPWIPDIAGIDTVNVLNSTDALDLEDLPASLLVLGGGYIGCELAQMFSRLGSAVLAPPAGSGAGNLRRHDRLLSCRRHQGGDRRSISCRQVHAARYRPGAGA
jgi:mercuric reductase